MIKFDQLKLLQAGIQMKQGTNFKKKRNTEIRNPK
jgi:hypothetical protein